VKLALSARLVFARNRDDVTREKSFFPNLSSYLAF